MEHKEYQALEMELIELQASDIIVGSGGSDPETPEIPIPDGN